MIGVSGTTLAYSRGAVGYSGGIGASSSNRKAGGRLRVLHLGRVSFIGGAERVMLTVACAGRQQGIDTFLACPDGRLAEEARREGLPVNLINFSRMRITANPLRYLAYAANRITSARRLVKLCRELEIDVLHAHHPVTALYCERAVRELGLPLVLHLHEGLPARPLYKLALRRAARLTAKILCVSSAGVDLLRASSADFSRAVIVHNGVGPACNKLEQDSTGSAEAGEARVAVIGVLEPRKGQDIFIQAAAMIAPLRPKMRFYIVGDTPATGSASYKQRLRSLVSRYGLERSIEFVPYVPNISEKLNGFDIIVSSSVSLESLSLIMLEAMSMGRTVVSTNLGGIADVIEHGSNGFLAESGSAQSLASSLNAAIACDRNRVGLTAMRTIEARFSIEQMSAAVERVYREVVRPRLVTS